MAEKKAFLNTRDQFIDGIGYKQGDVVEIEADRVSYMIAAGFLVDAPAKAPAKTEQAPAPEEPATETPAPDAAETAEEAAE